MTHHGPECMPNSSKTMLGTAEEGKNMKSLATSLIRSFGGSIYETGGMIAGVFDDDDLAQRCAEEIMCLFEGSEVEVNGECLVIWALCCPGKR